MKYNFSRDVEAFAKKANEAVETVVRIVVFEVFAGTIAGTPVDTGRARGNWQVGVGFAPSGVTDRKAQTGPVDSPGAKSAALGQIGSLRVTLGETYHLVNNLPYIERLEFDGWSGQAPEGMVRKNIARVQGILRKAVQENKV